MSRRKRRTVTEASQPEKEPVLRVAGPIRELPGWRVLVADIPLRLIEEHAVANHEPDVKQHAEGWVLRELFERG